MTARRDPTAHRDPTAPGRPLRRITARSAKRSAGRFTDRFALRTLRARLIAGLLALLLVTLAGVGVAVTTALQHYLVQQLDQRLTDAGGRYAASLEHGTASSAGARSDTRAQSPGTFGARLLHGTVTNAGVVDGDADDTDVANGTVPADTDDTVRLDPADQQRLASLAVGGPPVSVRLSALGPYRVRAVAGQDGDVLVTGLPLHQVGETEHQVLVLELAAFAIALATAGIAGALWVRIALRPLDLIADTAERVSALPLATGEVVLSERAPEADPRTETGRVGLSLNRMLGHVEQALAQRHASENRLRSFAADASHELRTPVATIRAHTELALRYPGEVPTEVRHSLERVEAETHRMGAIVADLLLLARLDAGRPLASDQVDLTRIALDRTQDARAAAPAHHWRLELPAEPVLVTGDEHRLHQVVSNLLTNAHRHTPDGTTVTLRIEGHRLTITDDGPGIPPEVAPHVFERFVRGDRSRTRAGGGTGLGLAIVHAVVAAHGGTVRLAPGPEGGTVATVELP
ncbi:HAMP domain-containing sensor histidine kinase [Kitasatospora sp. GP82]|uniref:sensor histidine kinase n=1 Tax=Kitasatospora sp. GP82 TaxID=3035089 RepID=UPI0024733E65|nr:HAMP domain-containing sensor histidine kinase [Kitasatospora sp. GP82]MDH6124033.1 two-component system OmpR family sensor kinase [Kitasatospora sp. GP82]